MYNILMIEKDYTSQKGSALFIILIAVALFAALSYTVAGMLQKGGSTNELSKRQSELYAGEILDYARVVRQKVQELRISNGCSDTDISFENNIVAGYTNGTNTDCQVFSPDGGGLAFLSPSEDVNDGSAWLFNGDNNVVDVGTAAPELVMILPNLDSDICTEINEGVGITVTGTDSDIDFSLFTGAYTSSETLDFADGFLNGCLNFVNSGDNFFFYQVLITR